MERSGRTQVGRPEFLRFPAAFTLQPTTVGSVAVEGEKCVGVAVAALCSEADYFAEV